MKNLSVAVAIACVKLTEKVARTTIFMCIYQDRWRANFHRRSCLNIWSYHRHAGVTHAAFCDFQDLNPCPQACMATDLSLEHLLSSICSFFVCSFLGICCRLALLPRYHYLLLNDSHSILKNRIFATTESTHSFHLCAIPLIDMADLTTQY